MPRIVRYGLIGALALAGVLLLVLALSSGNSPAFERNYPLLLGLNAVIALVLFAVVTALSLRLAHRVRKGRFGARLMTRFALAFALIGVAPGVLVYMVSSLFISRSIESWFNVQVEGALDSGLELGRAVLEAQRDELRKRAQAMAAELADTPPAEQFRKLDQLRERAGADEALWVTLSGSLIASSTSRAGRLMPVLPTGATLRAAQAARGLAVIEGDELSTEPGGGLRTRVIVPVPSPSPPELRPAYPSPPAAAGLRESEPAIRFVEPSFLQLTRSVAPDVAANAQALRAGYGQYQQLSLSRVGLQKMYRLTLTLTLLLAIFAAIASGVMLAGSMTAPLIELAAGTRAVAEGDYRPVREFRGNDELNVLTRSFNEMTRQLSDARDTVEARSRELETARGFLQRVLSNLSAGVIVLDADSRIVTANLGAGRILGVSLEARVGDLLSEVHPQLAEQVSSAFRDHSLAGAPRDSWQRQMKLDRAGAPPGSEPLSLLARGSRLALDAPRPGSVIVFDDITQVISAQRAVAWGEVARRLAHEIKNPLTPIQLAAERLQMKLAGELGPEQAEVLVRGASTIVNQVAAMKRMVDEFREYARLPPPQMSPLDLNALVEEIGSLYGAEARGGRSGTEEAARGGPARIELQLAARLPMIEGDASHLRQLVHNLVSNAQESIAGAHAADASRAGAGRIVIRTEAVAVDGAGGTDSPSRAVRLSVEDNGPGFPANILRRAFEPYVTTKPRGTGLGLAMVKKIVDEHDARIELINRLGGAGATVTVVFRRVTAVAGVAA